MWADVVPATSGALVWLLLTGALFVQLRPQSAWAQWLAARKRPFRWLLLIALLLRLVPMLVLPVGAGYDIESYQLVGQAMLNGNEVYTSAARYRHPYLPMQMAWIGLSLRLALATSLPFVVWVKLLPVLADVGITAVLFKAVQRWGKGVRTAVFAGLLYALNPISLLVSAYHGQFDPEAVLLLLLAWYAWTFGQRETTSATALGFAILNKTWPVVMLPLMLFRLRGWRSLIRYGVIALGIPTAVTVLYIAIMRPELQAMLGRALTHTGNAGYWGLSAPLAVLAPLAPLAQTMLDGLVAANRWLILAAGVAAWWLTRRQPLAGALLTAILVVLAVSVGMGIQWLLWIIPFAILEDDLRWLKWYTVAGAFFLLVQLYGLHMYPWLYVYFTQETADTLFRLGSLPAWLMTLLWAGKRLWQTAVVAPRTVAPPAST